MVMVTNLHDKLKISVITATYNSEKHIGQLIRSLRAQSDKDFEWIIADGGSTDKTLSILEKCVDLKPVVSSQKDFGIYDALNRGIKIMNSDYYIVIGSDDYFYPSAIKFFKKAISISSADIIAAKVASNGKIQKRIKFEPRWFGVYSGSVYSHAVGSAFKKSLHERFGFYSNTLPIAADALFIKQARLGGASCYFAPFVAGEFVPGGVSSKDSIGVLTEFFRIQMMTENKLLQTILFVLRILKNFKKL